MKGFATLTVAGIAGLLLLKILTALVLPVFGALMGMVFLVIKIALLGVVAYLVYSFFKRRDEVHTV